MSTKLKVWTLRHKRTGRVAWVGLKKPKFFNKVWLVDSKLCIGWPAQNDSEYAPFPALLTVEDKK